MRYSTIATVLGLLTLVGISVAFTSADEATLMTEATQIATLGAV